MRYGRPNLIGCPETTLARKARLWVTAGYAVMALACAPARVGAQDNADNPWTLVSTEHFKVYSGSGRKAGLELATDLEMLHAVLEQLAGTNTASPLGTSVYIFPRDAALQPFKPRHANGQRGSGKAVTGGFFAPRELANYVAINLRTSRSAQEVIQHEYLHYFAQHNLPKLPFWFNEGLAEYYSTFSVRDDSGLVGTPVARNLALLRRSSDYNSTRRDLSDLEQTRSSKELFDDGHAAALTYAQSWALVHFLLSDDELADATMGFMRELACGHPPEDAFRNSFGAGPESFSRDLRDYLAATDFPIFRADVRKAKTPLIESISGHHRDVALGDLALAVGNLQLAELLFDNARQTAAHAQPQADATEVYGRASIGLSRLAASRGDHETALLLAQEANPLMPDSPLPLLFEARTRFGLSEAMPRRPENIAAIIDQIDQSRTALRRSLKARPRFPASALTTGQTYIRDPRTPDSAPTFSDEGVRAFEDALHLMPQRSDIAVQAAMLQALRGRFELASKVLRRERPRFDTTGWGDAWLRIGSIETNLLNRELSRYRQAPLAPEELARAANRVESLDAAVATVEQLGSLYDQLQELARLLELETLWTQYGSALALATQGEPEASAFEIENVLDKLHWNRQLEGPRVKSLKRQATAKLRELAGSV